MYTLHPHSPTLVRTFTYHGHLPQSSVLLVFSLFSPFRVTFHLRLDLFQENRLRRAWDGYRRPRTGLPKETYDLGSLGRVSSGLHVPSITGVGCTLVRGQVLSTLPSTLGFRIQGSAGTLTDPVDFHWTLLYGRSVPTRLVPQSDREVFSCLQD